MAFISDTNDATTLVAEAQLKSYIRFMNHHDSQLLSIENALGCSPNTNKDKSIHPILIQSKPEEKLSLIDVITTDNKILNKVLIALCALCNETIQLEEEAKSKFYNQLLFYGEKGQLDEEADEGESPAEAHEQISRVLPLLQNLLCFVQRCREVLKNTIQQMAALYNKSFPQVIDVSQVHFSVIFEHIGILLRVLLTIDEIVLNNSILQNHWGMFKEAMKSLHINPASFDVKPEKVVPLEKLVKKIDNIIMSSRLMFHCMEQDFDDSGIPVSKNTLFIEEFSVNMRYLFARLDPKLGDNVCELSHSIEFVGFCCLYALNCRIFHDVNKKFFRQIMDVNKKLPCVVLIGPVTWFIEKFFGDYLPTELQAVDAKTRDQCLANRKTWLANKIESLPKDFQHYFFSINNWLVKMTSSSDASESLEDLSIRTKLYLEGISLGGRLKRWIECLFNLHVALNKPMTVAVVKIICRLVTMCKSVNDCFYRYSNQVTHNSLHIVQRIQHQLLSSMENVKKKLVSDKRYSNRRLDMLCALVLVSNSINAAPTKQRLIVAAVSLALANQSKLMRDEDYLQVVGQLSNLSLLSNTISSAYQATEQSAFYWHRVGIMESYFKNLHNETYDATDLHFMFSSLEDCVPCLHSTVHLSSSAQLADNYRRDVLATFKQHFLDQLFKNVEYDLRLSVHTHLKLDDRNPFRVGIKSLRQGLALKPINFMGEFIDIKALTTHYLDQTFYNLTTVALHDWKTYGEMRKCATTRYQLKMQEVHLPNQQLEQGLDVLEIMRNIHVFCPKYLYNLSNQIFVEKWSNNKHLNTINIQHIANSIRTHGSGIINTTVNFTFQFLKQKFFIFSQFLFDEHIKSRLVKDIRDFRANCEQLKHQYPFEAAEKFNRGIRKLGVTKNGTFLDQFRTLITHIGNAMGYIRMVRTGGLHFTSDAISFVPDLEEIVNFEELCKADGMGEDVQEGFEHFDHAINRLAKNVGEGSDYFRMLVDVFAPEFRNKKNMHLLNFFIIVPALTINFVEHVIICKEKMNKKNKVGAAFTDDGFAMGLAYILQLLDQNSQFDALHWFQSVRRKYAGDASQQQQQQEQQQAGRNKSSNTADENESLLQTKTLALKRINIYQREFDLLYYSLSSARIFFRAGSPPPTSKTDEKSEQANSNNNNNGESSDTVKTDDGETKAEQ